MQAINTRFQFHDWFAKDFAVYNLNLRIIWKLEGMICEENDSSEELILISRRIYSKSGNNIK